jgi:hypothetical protein
LSLSSINFRNTLSYFLIRKLNVFNLIGEANIVAFTNTLKTSKLHTIFHVHILTNRMDLLSESIDTLSKPAYLFLLKLPCPVTFWDEAFSTAMFLINRFPTRVIDNATPLERLLGDKAKPNYDMLKGVWLCLLSSLTFLQCKEIELSI